MRKRDILSVLMLSCGSLALLASGAAAEWLVGADGSKVEIDGPWEVEGRLVTFKLPNGTLGSMPLAAVDLEASQALQEAAAAEASRPKQPAAKPKAVLVITDADVGHPNLGRQAPDDDSESPEESSSPALRVTGWRESVELARNSVSISGSLQNPTENPATSIRLDVKLLGEDGQLLETSRARLEQGFLNPGATVRFEATFNDTLSYDSVQFEILNRGFLSRPPAAEEQADGQEEEGSS